MVPPPRDESAAKGDAEMAARLRLQQRWSKQHGCRSGARRRRQLEVSDARDARETAQEQERLLAQRSSAPAARAARGAEGGSSTASVRLQCEADTSALGCGAAGGGASSSLSSPDATSAAHHDLVTIDL